MTGPEANQQHDLWIDRCRQQLQRGAASNALAAWMQSEGVSAEAAAAILQMARDRLAAASGQTTQETNESGAAPESPAPATADAQDGSVPPPAAPQDAAQTTESTPAPAAPGGHAVAFAKAFAKPDDAGAGATTAAPAPASAADDLGPVAAPPSDPATPPQSHAMASQPPTGQLGALQPDAAGTEANTPVAPPPQTAAAEHGDVDPPAEPPAATVPQQADIEPPAQPPPPQVSVSAPAAADIHPESPQPADQEASAELLSQQPPQATEPEGLSAVPPAAAPMTATNPFGTPRPPMVFAAAPESSDGTDPDDRPAPEPEPQSAGIGLQVEGEGRQDLDAAPDKDGVGDVVGAFDPPTSQSDVDPASATEPPVDSEAEASTEPAQSDPPGAQEPTAPAPPELPADNSDPPEDEGEDPDFGASDAEPAEANLGPAGDPTPPGPAAVTRDPPAEPDDLAEAQPPRDAAPPPDQTPAPDTTTQPNHTEDPSGDETAQLEAALRESQRRAVAQFDKHFGRRERPRDRVPPDRPSVTPAPDNAAEDDEDALTQAIHDAGRQEPSLEASIPPGDRGGPPPRAAPSAESGRALRAGPAAPRPGPMTEEELAAAARELGISFRDEPGRRSAREPIEDDPELLRAARQLGISFRDDPAEPAPLSADDPMAKAARELGISFRDEAPKKVKEQSTLRRYWPIILVMVLAAIAMPIAATVLMFTGD